MFSYPKNDWKITAALFISGIVFLVLAFAYLPFIIVVPGKFATSFGLGSLLVLTAIASYKGFKEFLTFLF